MFVFLSVSEFNREHYGVEYYQMVGGSNAQKNKIRNISKLITPILSHF